MNWPIYYLKCGEVPRSYGGKTLVIKVGRYLKFQGFNNDSLGLFSASVNISNSI